MASLLAFDAHPTFEQNGRASLFAMGMLRATDALEPPPVALEQAPDDWEPWLHALFPSSIRAGFAPRHVAYWRWLWAITQDEYPDPFVGLWPRGGAKSSSVELGVAALGLRNRRRYVLYVRDTQDRADDSVTNIAKLLESDTVARHYPEHAERSVGKFGNSQGWRRNRIRTAGGFTVDALGLDVAARGAKLGDYRPDVIVFDDIDGRHDTAEVTTKKTATITDSLLPAGTANVGVIFIQNLIIPNGIAAQLADGRAMFLARRIVSGPEPAVRGLETEMAVLPNGLPTRRITAGTPTWAGQDLTVCQAQIHLWGWPAFSREAQHNVREREGALWTVDLLNRRRVGVVPPLKRIVIGVDPSGGTVEIGIVAAGIGYDDRGYVLDDRTAKGALGPANWGRVVATLYHDRQADRVAAEKNFGGDMVLFTLHVADPTVPVLMVNASRGKAQRAEPVAALYEEGRVDHVGAFPELEAEMTGWKPGDKASPNRLDALVWTLTELMLGNHVEVESYASESTVSFA